MVVNGEDFTTSTKTVSVDGDGAIVPGALLNWEISLINTGNRNGVVSLTDPIPAVSPEVVSYEVLHRVSPQNVVRDGRLTITGTVPPDQTRTVSFSTVLADVVDGTELRNIAYLARDDQEDLSIAANVLVVARGGLLAGTWTFEDVDGAPLGSEDELALTLILENVGGANAQQIAVALPLDENLEFVSAGDGGQLQGNRIVWSGLGDLAAGETLTLSMTLRTRPDRAVGTAIALTDQLSGANIPSTGSETLELTIDAPGLLALDKAVEDLNGGDYRPGDVVRYALTIRNEGEVLVRNGADGSRTRWTVKRQCQRWWSTRRRRNSLEW